MNDSGNIEIGPGVYAPEAILDFSFSRSSGPGGQSVNKLNTRAVLNVALDDLMCYLPEEHFSRLKKIAHNRITSDDILQIADQQSRSQLTNKRNCLERLWDIIARAQIKPKRRRKTKPTRASVRRRLDHKRKKSDRKRLRKRVSRDDFA